MPEKIVPNFLVVKRSPQKELNQVTKQIWLMLQSLHQLQQVQWQVLIATTETNKAVLKQAFPGFTDKYPAWMIQCHFMRCVHECQ
jgi:hypothetical protein